MPNAKASKLTSKKDLLDKSISLQKTNCPNKSKKNSKEELPKLRCPQTTEKTRRIKGDLNAKNDPPINQQDLSKQRPRKAEMARIINGSLMGKDGTVNQMSTDQKFLNVDTFTKLCSTYVTEAKDKAEELNQFTTIEKEIEMVDNIFISTDEPQPIGFIGDPEIEFYKIDNSSSSLESPLPSKPKPVTTTYYERHLLNVIFTKVHAHYNGFLAKKLPKWYELTFGKTLPQNWLDLIKISERFSLDNVKNEIVLHALEQPIESGGDICR